LISAVTCDKKKAVSTPKKYKLELRFRTVEYTPTDEIKNAQLSFGLIQIGNVFLEMANIYEKRAKRS
jgi:hypothetical protein